MSSNAYVITYRGQADPPPQEERDLLAALDTVSVVDRMPGIVLVEGDTVDVETSPERFPAWTCSPEVALEPQPRRTR